MTQRIKVDKKNALAGIFLVVVLYSFSIGYLFALWRHNFFFFWFSVPIGVIGIYHIYRLLNTVFSKSDRIIVDDQGLSFIVNKNWVKIKWRDIEDLEHKISINKDTDDSVLLRTSEKMQYLLNLDGLNKPAKEIVRILNNKLKSN